MKQPQIIHIHETTSTNQYLRELATGKKLPEGTIVTAEFQTAGRGQAGNSWESEKGKNLTFSTILYPEGIPANRQFLIAQIASLSVKETLDYYTHSITIKWPNDIYWKEKKICGMLIENDLTGPQIYCSVIGIGINLNQRHFLSNAPNPASLTQITGEKYDPEEVLKRFQSVFYSYYLELLQEKEGQIREKYHAALFHKAGYHLYEDKETQEKFQAAIHTTEPTGHLILQLKDKSLKRYAFKEVSYVL
ncbi:MAG: biotin--[acetyl-CoA-carboxylase] ligase [Tannerellaceae bacterium]|nr:biotin--[acetyl-CoA-carboxylase] ligase [Tannerellaceae bacterium]